MEREDQQGDRADGRAPIVPPYHRPRARRGRLAAAALGALLATTARSAHAQTQDLILSKTAQIGNAQYTGVVFRAFDEDVDLFQNPNTVLSLTQGNITKLGPFNSLLTGGFVTIPTNSSAQYNVAVIEGMLTINSALASAGRSLTLDAKSQGTLVLGSTANDLSGGITVNGGTLRIADDRNLGNRDKNNFVLLNGGALEILDRGVVLGANRFLGVGTNGGEIRLGLGAALAILGDDQLRGSGMLQKTGAGTLILGGSNRFDGNVNVTGGALELRETFALSSRTQIGLTGTTLNLRSDQAQALYGHDIFVSPTANGAPSTIDIGSFGGKVGHFRLGALTVGGGTLRLSNSLNDGSILHFAGAANLASNANVETVGKTVVWFDNLLTGRGALTKSGEGVLYLAGGGHNTNASLISVLNGELRLAKTSPGLTAVAGNLLVNGGSVRLDTHDQIADASSVHLQLGAFRVNGQTEKLAYFRNDAGTLTTGVGGKLILTGGPLQAPAPARALRVLAASGPLPAEPLPSLVIAGGTTTVNAGGVIDAFSAQISGGTNTVEPDGVFSVGDGGLSFTGTASPNLTLVSHAATPGRLLLGGTLTFGGTAGTASITTSGVAAQPGAVDMVGALREFNVADGTAATDLLVTAKVTNGSLRKAGAGTLRLEGANALTGVTINAGALEVKNAAALGAAAITLNAGTLRVRSDAALTTLTGAMTTAGDAAIDVDRDSAAGGAGPAVVEFGSLTIGASRLAVTGANNRSARLTGPVSLTGTAILETGAPLALSGVVSGAFGVTKEGVGKLTFDGAAANTFSGTTRVNAGALELNKTAGNAVPGPLSIFGGSARLLRANQIADTAAVQIQNPGSLLDLNGQAETIASLNGSGGGVALGAGGVLTVTQGTYTGVISGDGMVVQHNPLGGTTAAVTLGSTQTFTGGVLVNHGSVTFSGQTPRHVGTTLTGGTWGVYNGSSLNFNAGSNITTSAANVTLSGAASSFAKLNALSNNQGTLTITGGKAFTTAGALTNSGTITVGPASQLTLAGTLTNTGVTTTTGTLAAAAAINTSGTLTVSGPQAHAATASLAVTGGSATLNTDAGSPTTYNLAVSVTGGTLTLTTTQHLRSLHVAAPITLGDPAASASAGNAVVVTRAFTTAGTGRLDLANNSLVFDYAGAAGPAMTTVRAAVLGGYAGGAWTGPGIGSSVAAKNVTYAVGFAESSLALRIAGAATANFRGETVDATAVLARFTKIGDADLNGIVNFDDLLLLASNYNSGGGAAVWSQGDFNYNGLVNFDDLLLLASNYNRSLAAEPLPASAPPEFAADLALAIAQVPEPATFAPLAALACAAALRRRRRQT